MYVQSAQGQEDDAYATAKNPLESVEVTTTGNVNQSYLILIRYCYVYCNRYLIEYHEQNAFT